MKIEIALTDFSPHEPVRVGNVYSVKGGRGSRLKHMFVLFAITESLNDKFDCREEQCLMLCIDKDGNPVGVTQYAMHYVNDLCPIAFVDGLEDLTLIMRSL